MKIERVEFLLERNRFYDFTLIRKYVRKNNDNLYSAIYLTK